MIRPSFCAACEAVSLQNDDRTLIFAQPVKLCPFKTMIKTLIFAQPVKLCPFKTDNEIAEKLWACSGQGDDVDFDQHVLGEAGDLDGGAGGRGAVK